MTLTRRLSAAALAGVLLAASLPSAASAQDRPSLGDGGADDAPTVTRSAGSTTKTYAAEPDGLKAISLNDDEVNVVGASWTGDDPGLEIRYRDADGWSSWEELPVDDEGGPDPRSAEGRQLPAKDATVHSAAVPVIDSSKVEVRSTGATKGTGDLEITIVATPVTKGDSAVAKKSPAVLSPQVAHHELGANIVTRKEWGADEKLVRCATDKTASAKGVFVHHTAGSNTYTKAQAPGIIRGYLAYHTQQLGWCDIGYNFLVDKYGTMYEGRAKSIDLAVTGAHASGFNSQTIGISVLGTYTSAAPSTAAQNSVKRLIAWKANQYGFNPTGSMTLTSGGGGTSKYPEGKKVSLKVISGHRDTSYTECPGTAFYNKLGTIRSGAKAMQSKVGGYPVKGAIGTYFRAHSAQTGEARSKEGTLKNPNGSYQRFAKGTVYWSSKTGAHLNKGGIRNGYKRAGYTKGILGYPSGDEKGFAKRKGTYYQKFEKGIITWSSKTQGHALRGDLLTKWRSTGRERGTMGLPTSGEYSWKGKTRQNFEHGYMTYKKGEGVKVYVS
ncbi:N-acetylmuramoyl-L-alanine amidase [Brevibacterium atlanticum]|uniref:N-acetylmuramoyl-L-alanine amidase n=1 Tax=Brevibacterium atlanticum TaxID=2697563 RepID=UPI001420BC5F|nr:N-acetylmuramoyl-L-alanine amidase [Brevibacterium atlanticum]